MKDPNIFNEPWSNDAESVMGQSFLFLFQTFVLRHHISTEFLISLWSIAVRKVLSFVVITLNVSTKWLYEPTLNRLSIDISENKVKDICISFLEVFRILRFYTERTNLHSNMVKRITFWTMKIEIKKHSNNVYFHLNRNESLKGDEGYVSLFHYKITMANKAYNIFGIVVSRSILTILL